MEEKVKKALYFPIASYFKFFASIRLRRWKPRIVVITGSSGKTTTLHLVESQIRSNVRYSHHANSAYGIPFDILDLHRKTFRLDEWLGIVLKAPLNAFKKPYKEKIYIVEADADRPQEGKFLAELLKPEVTIWLSSARTHSMNFDTLVQGKRFKNVDEAIAYEFGNFIENTTKLVIINEDNPLIMKQLKRTKASVEGIAIKNLKKYTVTEKGTEFSIGDKRYSFAYLLPQEVFYSIRSVIVLAEYLGVSIDYSFRHFVLPPGRSSIFRGVKNTVLIDSSYNANLSSMSAMLSMFNEVSAKSKWVILGDMPEQGNVEKEEHENLAEILSKMKINKILLKGRLVSTYTYPVLKEKNISVEEFMNLKDVYDHIMKHLEGDEVILFKGGQSMMLEGIIEKLIRNKDDVKELPRREKIWKERRAKQGL